MVGGNAQQVLGRRVEIAYEPMFIDDEHGSGQQIETGGGVIHD
jgi:hypothetical protein